jgi:5-methylcytosine-specific restriction endonuclease McrA
MGKERDHIWPKAEGGPNKGWNYRDINRSENRQKGARMPTLGEVSQSTDPIRLSVEIDKHTITKGLKIRRNRDKGFGGLPRI